MNGDDLAIHVAAAIQDFTELVEQLSVGARGPLPWQRQLTTHLDGLAGLVQILRLSVVLEHPHADVREAARALVEHTRRATVAVMGSRADPMARIALRLALRLALTINAGLHATPDAPPTADGWPHRA